MSIVKMEIAFDAENKEAREAVITMLNVLGGAEVKTVETVKEQVATEEKTAKTRTRTTKAVEETKVEETKVEETKVEETKVEETKVEEKPKSGITQEQIREVMSKLIDKDHPNVTSNRMELKAKLTELGAANVTTLPTDKNEEFFKFLKSLE